MTTRHYDPVVKKVPSSSQDSVKKLETETKQEPEAKKEPEAKQEPESPIESPAPEPAPPKPVRLTTMTDVTRISAFDTVKDIGVQLIGEDEKPVPGHRLEIKLTGEGKVNDHPDKTTITTDEIGNAYFDLQAGKKAGNLKVRIRCLEPEHQDISTELLITIAPNEPANLDIHNNQQAYPSGKQLPKPMQVVVQDRLGNPVGNVPVYFKVTMGDGLLDDKSKEKTVETDDNGKITMNFTLGKQPGFNAVDVRIPGTDLMKAFQAVGQD